MVLGVTEKQPFVEKGVVRLLVDHAYVTLNGDTYFKINKRHVRSQIIGVLVLAALVPTVPTHMSISIIIYAYIKRLSDVYKYSTNYKYFIKQEMFQPMSTGFKIILLGNVV